MKLILTIIDRKNAKRVNRELLSGGFQVTKLDSRGGFLGNKSNVLLSTVLDERVPKALEIIRNNSSKRETLDHVGIVTNHLPRTAPRAPIINTTDYLPSEISLGGATVFVLNVEQLEKI